LFISIAMANPREQQSPADDPCRMGQVAGREVAFLHEQRAKAPKNKSEH
jgi:hypothetical protein